MSISPEVEKLVQRALGTGCYASENAVLLAALQALTSQQQARPRSPHGPEHRPSPLGTSLREIRRQYTIGGGILLTAEQLDKEVSERRGERYPEDLEE